MSEQSNVAAFEQWCILEMLGHVRLAGKVEQNLFGCALGRIDIPTPDGQGFTTQFFGGGSIYRLTPTTEEIARAVAGASQTEPVHRWELPAPKEAGRVCVECEEDQACEGSAFCEGCRAQEDACDDCSRMGRRAVGELGR